MNRFHIILALVLGLIVLAAGTAPNPQSDKPSARDVKAWVQEYMDLGSRATKKDRARQLELYGSLQATEALTERDVKKWTKSLLKTWSKGTELPHKKGDGHYWEEERRGRYIVGGKTKKPQGLLIAMHGGGVGQADAGPAAASYAPIASANKWLLIAPQAIEKTELGWTTAGTEEWIMDLVEQARRTFKIDANHVIFAGHSMGGFGSWTLGAHHADRVAALAPSAGAPTPIMDRDTKEIIDIDDGVVPSLRNVPMVVFQSIDDRQVPPGPNQFAAKAVAKAKERWGGYDHFDYWEVDGRGHGRPKGGIEAQFDRFPTLIRQPIQDVVVWQPALDWKRQFYWLHWEQPGIGAIVEARIDREANSISVKLELPRDAEPGSGLSILLNDSLVDMEKEVMVQFNDSEVFKGVPERRLEVLVETSLTGDSDRQYVSKIPLQ